MKPQVKLWLEDGDGRLTMSDFRAEMLRQVRSSGSLAFAAAAMGLSYRRAWGKLRELEQHLGYAVIHSTPGGSGGGSSRLTPEGELLLEQYTRFQADCRQALAEAYARNFPADAAPRSSGEGGTVAGPTVRV